MYLVKDDYTIRIDIDQLDKILAKASTGSGLTAQQILTQAEDTAEAEINAYLSAYYDTATEFAIDGSTNPGDRNKNIVRCMIDISLFNVFFTVSPRDIPVTRENLYNKCIEMLKAYRDGELDFGLTVVDADSDGEADVSRTMLESSTKFTSKPFSDPRLLS